MRLTRTDIEKVYDELDRRINNDVEDGLIPNSSRFIREEYRSRLQGVYGTIMALVPNENWRDIVWWMDDIEADRYSQEVRD